MTIRNQYEQELRELKNHLVEMAQLSERAVTNVIDAICKNDRVRAESVMLLEKEIAAMEALIEKLCFHIMIRQQPVARDFREVSAALKIITDLARIGHQVSDVAEMVMGYCEQTRFPTDELIKMAELAKKMVVKAVDSFISPSVEQAEQVVAMDDMLDDNFLVLTKSMVETMKKQEQSVEPCVIQMMMAKYFERIGDHAVNIADWVIYYETGKHIKGRYHKN